MGVAASRLSARGRTGRGEGIPLVQLTVRRAEQLIAPAQRTLDNFSLRFVVRSLP